MTVNEVRKSEGGGPRGGPQKNAIANRQVQRLVHDLQQMRRDRDGVTVKGIDDLGPRTQEYLKNLYPELVDNVQSDGAIPRPLLNKLRNELYKLDKLERHVLNGPKGGDQNATIDERKYEIEDDGINGLGEGALRSLLKGFGLDNGFDRKIANVLRGNAGANLSDPKTWNSVGNKMLDALLSSEGSIQERLGAVLGAGTEAVIDAATSDTKVADAAKMTGSIDAHFGPVPNSDLGLEKTAGGASNVGSMNNAFSIRAQLLTGITGQNEQVRNVTAKALKEVFRDLDVFQGKNTPEDRVAKRKIHELIGGELNKLQVDGKLDASKLLGRLGEMIAERSGDDESAKVFASMTEGLQQICAAHPEAAASDDAQTCIALGCAMALSDLVAVELGKNVNHRSSLNEQLMPMVQELIASAPAQSTKATDAKGDPKATKADLSSYAQARPDLAQGRQVAEQYIGEMRGRCSKPEMLEGTPLDPSSEPFNTFANVLSEIALVAREYEAPECLVAYQWLADNAGLDPKMVQQVHGHLEQSMKTMASLDQLLKTCETTYESESKRMGSSQDHGRLQQLQLEISKLRTQIKQQATLPRMYFDHAASMISKTCMDGRMHGNAALPTEAAGAGGGGGKIPPGGGGGGGKVPPGGEPPNMGPNNWGRRNRTWSRGNMPGFTAPAGPHDKADAPFYQRRANMLGDILSDSSLCIEDKIFFFMMWFVAFADEEREQKMKELIEMDRKQAELAQTRDEKSNELSSQYQTLKSQKEQLRRAEADCNRLEKTQPPPAPEKMAEAQATFEAAKKNVGLCEDRIQDLKNTVQDLKRQGDELPKSREVKFMELERLNQLRDKIMNMARSILENSNRNIEKIFR